MDSKDKGLTLSQKIVTDAVLRKNDYNKREWLSRRYGKGRKLDQAFEKIFSSISYNGFKVELLLKLNAGDDRISDVIENEIDSTGDFHYIKNMILPEIRHVKDEKKRFDLIKKVDNKVITILGKNTNYENKYIFDLRDVTDYIDDLSRMLEDFNEPKFILSFLSLDRYDLGSIVKKMSTLTIDEKLLSSFPKVAQTIDENNDAKIESICQYFYHLDDKQKLILINCMPENKLPYILLDSDFLCQLPSLKEKINNASNKDENDLKLLYEKISRFELSKDAPEGVKKMYYAHNYDRYSDILEQLKIPSNIEFLIEKNIDLNLIFSVKDNEQNYVDVNVIASQFDDKKDAIKTIALYKAITYYKDYVDSKDPKESIYQHIYNSIIAGSKYLEDMPEDFKKAHPDLFLSQDTPEELRELLCNRGLTSEKLLEHPEWIDILAEESINLNAIFHFGRNHKINNEESINDFETRKEAIKCIAIYNQMNCSLSSTIINKESIYQEMRSAILHGRAYPEDMPEDFKKAHSDLFLSEEAPEKLKKLVCEKRFEGNYTYYSDGLAQALRAHPKWIDILATENINLNVLFHIYDEEHKQIDANVLAEQFESRKDAIKIFTAYNSIMKTAENIDLSAPKESMYKNMYESILKGAGYYEDMPEDFKKEHPDLFLSQDTPEELRELLCNRRLTLWNLLEHPEWIDILAEENINLNLIFELKDANNNDIDIETIVNEFDNRKDVLNALLVCNRNITRLENVKEEIYSGIYKEILKGHAYSEDMPEDFKKAHPDLFLSEEAPEKLKKLVCEKRFEGNYTYYSDGLAQALRAHPKWIDILATENINLNVLFHIYDEEHKQIDANVLAEQFESRKDAIKIFTAYNSIVKKSKNINLSAPKESMYKNMYESILKGAGYYEDMPEDFKKAHPDLFLSQDAPEELKKFVYEKLGESYHRKEDTLRWHSEWIDILVSQDINLNVTFSFYSQNKENVNLDKLATKFEDKKEFMVLLCHYIKYDKVLSADLEKAKQDMLEMEYKLILSDEKYNMSYYKNMKELKKVYPRLFLSENVSPKIEYIFNDRSKAYRELLIHPEQISILINENINLNLIFKLRDENSKYIDIETIINEFDSKEDALNALVVYSNIRNSNTIPHFENVKEEMYFEIYEGILNGAKYLEDMPEDFKKEHPGLFLSEDAPEKLRELLCSRQLTYTKLLRHPEWINSLAEENIDLNLIFKLRDANNKYIDIETIVNEFDSREDAIKYIAMYKQMNCHSSDMTINKKSICRELKEKIEENSSTFKWDLFHYPIMSDVLSEVNIDLNLIFKLEDENSNHIDAEVATNEFNNRKEAINAWASYCEITKKEKIPNSKNKLYFEIYEDILHGRAYSENVPEDFKKEHPDLFLSKDAPEELKEFIYEKELKGRYVYSSDNAGAVLRTHPEWINILAEENINLNLIFKLMDANNKYIDIEAIVNEFDSRKDALNALTTYNWNGIIHPENAKEEIYLEIYKDILHGRAYPEDMPEDFKKEHPDLFLSEEAPKGLKKLVCEKRFEENYTYYSDGLVQTLRTYPEWIDILVTEDINLNVLFQIYDEEHKQIDVNILAEQFESRKDAIRIFTAYNSIVNTTKNIDLSAPKKSMYKNMYESILKGAGYYEDIPEDFKEGYPDLFLSQDAPEELRELLCNRELTPEKLLEHPEWVNVLVEENINLNLIFKLRDANNKYIDIETIINEFDSKEDALNALVVYSNIRNSNTIPHFENVKEEMYFEIYEGILNGAKYLEDMPEDFKKEHPELFLDKTVPEDIRTKFYKKQFTQSTLEDFEEDPNLIRTFGDTNLLFGLSDDKYQFLITLFKGPDANNERLKAIEIFNESTNKEEADFIRESIIESRETIGTIGIEKFPDLIELHKNVQYSNAVELSSFKRNFMREILNSDNPSATFKSLENIYLKGDLPGYAKLFKCFQTIYPKFEKLPFGYSPGFDFSPNSRISPELLEAGNAEHRFLIIYNDLLRTAVHSQDRTLIEYLNNINEGSELYFALNSGEKTIESISNEEVDKLTTFAGHLEALYKSISFPYQEELTDNAYKKDELTQKFKILERISAKDYFKDINGLVPLVEVEKYKRAMLKTKISLLSKKFNASTISTPDELKDKIVSYIGHSAGYDSFNQMVQDINRIRNNADKRNRDCAEEYRDKPFMFEEGDFVRGITYIDALTGSLNKGNVAKEFMCSYKGESGSDTTPLDVDITYIVPKSGITTSLDDTPTGWGFGNIFVVIKKDNPNFNITRDKDGNILDTKYDPNKVEMFGTRTPKGGHFNHWGARTGISFTDVDFILYKENKIIERDEHNLPMVDEKGNIVYVKNSNDRSDGGYVPIEHDALAEIQFEIARNGYYIPVIDMLGRLAFTPEQYDALRSKVAGLPYYSSAEYIISSKLDFPGIDELVEIKKVDMQKTAEKEKIVRGKVEEIIKNSKLDVDTIAISDTLSKDLTEGILQLIGTGSTSRGTNVPDDSDFDYMLKVDKKVYMHTTDTLIANFKTMEHEEDNSHDKRVRLAGVTVEGLEEPFDIDISIEQKKNNIQYSTEMALEERLKTIRKQSPDDYYKVIANIVYAKQFLKEIGVYKSARVNPKLGGLGGVGVENWILQNGGSFRQACETFLEKAFDPKTSEMVPFSDFKKVYTVWDFGENHESKGKHPFDEYVSLNMNEAGYNKLVKELPKKLKEINEGLSRMSEINSNAPVEIEPEIESKVEIETEEELEPMTASYGFGR